MNEKLQIRETIVVEGRDDVAAVKQAVDAEVITTGGFALSARAVELIRTAAKRTGVIIFTDPDYAGEQIRKRVAQLVPDCKHAFINKEEAIKDGDLGVENASPEAIRKALSKVRVESPKKERMFTMTDMVVFGLTGNELAGFKRALIGEELGLGYTNAKQFLSRLNSFGVTAEELEAAVAKANTSLNQKLN